MNKKLLDAIVANGDEYCRRHLSKYATSLLQKNWWDAFDFFLSRACFQGRRDAVSILVYNSAVNVLAPLFSTQEAENNFSRHANDKWKDLSHQLSNRIGKGKIGKARDVEMIVSALSYV